MTLTTFALISIGIVIGIVLTIVFLPVSKEENILLNEVPEESKPIAVTMNQALDRLKEELDTVSFFKSDLIDTFIEILNDTEAEYKKTNNRSLLNKTEKNIVYTSAIQTFLNKL